MLAAVAAADIQVHGHQAALVGEVLALQQVLIMQLLELLT
jgi:hypothetical protein